MKKHLILISLVLSASFVHSACGAGQPFGPTLTPTTTLTPTLTLTPVPVTGQMEGNVYWSSDKKPIAEFSLTLDGTEDGNEKFEFTTGPDGKYSFNDLEPGKYSLGIAWEIDKSGDPVPCQNFQIDLPDSVTGPRFR